MKVDVTPNLGGMEKAFSMNVLMLLANFFAGHSMSHITGEAAPTTKQRRKRKQICSRSGDRVWAVWDSLPSELLLSVLMKLNFFDYFAFGSVCRSWRLASIDIRKTFMERLQPLVVARPRYSKKACVLYNIFDGKSCNSMLLKPSKDLWGLSSGYMITTGRDMDFWLVNLLTRHELQFPVLPKGRDGIFNYSTRAVHLWSTQLSKFFMVIFSTYRNYLLLSESGASSTWHKYVLPNARAGISDVKILDGKIFVLTCDAHFGEFNPRADPVLKLYNINIPIQLPAHSCLQLVTSDNKMYMIISQYRYPNISMWIQYHSLYELDYTMESVKQIHDLGSKSLFLSQFNSALVDTTGWGAGNCVCVLQNMHRRDCSFFHLNGNELATARVVWDDYLTLYFWYFPGESRDVSCVGDEFGM